MTNQSRWKQRYQLGSSLINNTKGATILVSMIIISAVLLVISLSLGVNSIAENQINLYQSVSQKVFINADGCADEALIRLSRDNAYTGETLMIDETSCVIGVSGGGNSRTITVEATNSNYTKNLQINVTINPTFDITAWAETTN